MCMVKGMLIMENIYNTEHKYIHNKYNFPKWKQDT